MEPTDAELLALIRKDDQGAKSTFAQRHMGWANFYASTKGAGDLTEDVAQNVLLAMILRPPKALRTASAVPYMRTAIKREIMRLRGTPLVLIDGGSRSPGSLNILYDGTSPTEAVARDELMRPALKAVAELPTTQRGVVMLRQAEGLTFAEIAAITGRGESTLRTSHSRGLEKLRRKLARFFLGRNER